MRTKREKLIRSVCKYYQSGGHCHHPDHQPLIDYINDREPTSFCSRPEECKSFIDYAIEELQKK